VQTSDGGAGLEVTAVARRLGVAPATLRSWHRRYGIGPDGHSSGRRRLYRPEDVARLEVMHAALVRGVPAAEAARAALAAALPAVARPAVARPAVARPAVPGGRGLALPGAGRQARGLARAALALDPAAVHAVLGESLAAVGVVRTWDELVRPVLGAVAERWERDGSGVEVEHLLSECVVRELDGVGQHGAGARPVLLACAPGEAHSLPLNVLAAALRERGVGAHLLGAAVPGRALAAAVDRTAPVAALIWAQAPPDEVVLPPSGRSRCRWFTGGPGWTDVPPGAARVTTLQEATDALAAAALGPAPP
jgi:transposase-like protein